MNKSTPPAPYPSSQTGPWSPDLEEEADDVRVEHEGPPEDAGPQRGVLLGLEHGDQTLRLCTAVKETN